jgi:hypothetical protein
MIFAQDRPSATMKEKIAANEQGETWLQRFAQRWERGAKGDWRAQILARSVPARLWVAAAV